MGKYIFRGLVVTAVLVGSFAAVTGASQFAQALPNGKDTENTQPDPDRPYYDGCGNKFSYDGTLISQGNGCEPEPAQAVTTLTTTEAKQCQ
jgi:hypothetical protein